MHLRTVFSVLCVAAAFGGGAAWAQQIYTCVDAKGRKITADRPIAECTDRTQNELSPSGTVKRQLGPSLTARERAAQEARDKVAEELRARDAEEKRRDRALLLRYPSRAVHEQERATALKQVDEVIKASTKRSAELAEQRQAINTDMEFYAKNPAKAPQRLKRRIEENDSSVAVQKRFVADQDQEKLRISQRFDEELVKLNRLWALAGGTPSAAEAPDAAAAAKAAVKK